MTLLGSFSETEVEVSEETAEKLSQEHPGYYPVRVHPPTQTGDIPATLNRFTRNIMEIQSRLLGFGNASPVTGFEVYRINPEKIRFQFVAPTKRLERKIRTQLSEEIPQIEFTEGSTQIPVSEGDTIGGGLLTAGRKDHHPIRREFDRPPSNSLTTLLHRHATPRTRYIIQILFQPAAGKPVRDWWWRRNAFKQVGYLNKEKTGVYPWHDRSATPQEREQANQIENKARSPRYQASIRILVINAGTHTPSRLKEIAAGFNVFEDPASNQYFNTVTVTSHPPFNNQITRFAETIHHRKFDGYSRKFHASTRELAALLSLPDKKQENIPSKQ